MLCRAGTHTPAPADPLDAFQRELIGVLASVREALLKQEATAREMLEFMKEREKRSVPSRSISGHIEHGVTCSKASHIGTGYLHSPDDDTPYMVDGCRYCGRCHSSLPR